MFGPGVWWCELILKIKGSQIAWNGVRHRSALKCLAPHDLNRAQRLARQIGVALCPAGEDVLGHLCLVMGGSGDVDEISSLVG